MDANTTPTTPASACRGANDVARKGLLILLEITFSRNGCNVLELQHLLCHEQLATIRLYIDLAQTDLSAAQGRVSPADNWRL